MMQQYMEVKEQCQDKILFSASAISMKCFLTMR